MPNGLISIIIPTIGRSTEFESLMHSIKDSTYKHYEVIVVDQNHSGILDDIVLKYHIIMPVLHLKVDFVGAAKARNYGSQFANGKYLFFPDDDSELFPETLDQYMNCFKEISADVIFGKCVDRTLLDSVVKFSNVSGYLSFNHHEGMFIEATMFIKKKAFSEFLFDESFGIGTFYGAEEAYDLVLRMLYVNFLIYYTPDIKIYHPPKVVTHSNKLEIKRAFSYRCGFAHLCAKHKLYKKYYSRLLKVILYIPYTIVFSHRKTRYYLAELMGLLTGMIIR